MRIFVQLYQSIVQYLVHAFYYAASHKPEIVLDSTRDSFDLPLRVFQLHVSTCLRIWCEDKRKFSLFTFYTGENAQFIFLLLYSPIARPSSFCTLELTPTILYKPWSSIPGEETRGFVLMYQPKQYIDMTLVRGPEEFQFRFIAPQNRIPGAFS